MALGGGSWAGQTKILPGAYINFVGARQASSALSDRGIAAMPYVSDWIPDDKYQYVTAEDYARDSMSVFGWPYGSNDIHMMDELYKHAVGAHLYCLNTDAVKASNSLGTATRAGIRGNDITIVIAENTDESFNVRTYVTVDSEQRLVDEQDVNEGADLIDTAWVVWSDELELAETAGSPMTGGSNGVGRTLEAYQAFLDLMEGYAFNTLGCNTDDAATTALFVQYTKRMRDQVGKKFQTVVYRAENADHEGIISVENAIVTEGEETGEFGLVYWVTGAQAGCEINKSVMNQLYDGNYTVNVDYTQQELIDALQAGKFMFHRVNSDVRVLRDINTLTTTGADKNDNFKNNQVIRVIDQIGNDIALLFNTKYLGEIPNNESGRESLWADIVKHHTSLQDLEAIQDFDPTDVTVMAGDQIHQVRVDDRITPVGVMEQLYMTVVVE